MVIFDTWDRFWSTDDQLSAAGMNTQRTQIANNKSGTSQNTGSIVLNKGIIDANTGSISINRSGIAANLGSINVNIVNIANNVGSININRSNINLNLGSISFLNGSKIDKALNSVSSELVTWNGTDGKTIGSKGFGVVTTVGSPGTDKNIPTEKAIRDSLGGMGVISQLSGLTDVGSVGYTAGFILRGNNSSAFNAGPMETSDVPTGISPNKISFSGIPTNLSYIGYTDYVTVDADAIFGDLLYKKNLLTYALSNSSAASTIKGRTQLALGSINSGTVGLALIYGKARNDVWNFPIGSDLYVNSTGGQFTNTVPTSGFYARIVAEPEISGTIFFKPDNTYIGVN